MSQAVVRYVRGQTYSLSDKIADAVEYAVFDFTDLMRVAGQEYATISAATVSIEVVSGTDADKDDIIAEAPAFKADVFGYIRLVRQKLAGGVAGVTYKLTITLTTPSGVAPMDVYFNVVAA